MWFLENLPKRVEIYGLNLGCELEVQIWEFPEFGLTLERGDWRLSVEIVLPAFLFCFEVRSSGLIDARAGLCVTCSSGCRTPNRA